jgi:uncharacterized protein (TIGR02284 family)
MDNETRKLLNSIYANLKNSQRDYQEIYKRFSERLGNCSVREKFETLFAKRQQMIDAIEEEAELMGEREEEHETLIGAAQDLLIDLKFLLTSNNMVHLLEEAEKEDAHLADNYKKALKQLLPLSLETLLQYQFKEVQKDLKEMQKIHMHFSSPSTRHHLEAVERR